MLGKILTPRSLTPPKCCEKLEDSFIQLAGPTLCFVQSLSHGTIYYLCCLLIAETKCSCKFESGKERCSAGKLIILTGVQDEKLTFLHEAE